MLKIIILLTAFVGLIVPATAQVEPGDSIPSANSVPFTNDSTALADDSTGFKISPLTGEKLRLSTDSVYVTPVPSEDDLLPSMVEYTANDSIVGSMDLGEAFLYREAVVKYKDITIKAGFIKINFNSSEVLATGIKDSSGSVIQKPIFTESGKSYRADTMRYNFKSKKAQIKKVITQEGEGFLHGDKVKKVSDKVLYVQNASYTTCSHEDPHFKINTPKAKVITGDKIVTKFAYLELLEIPTPLMVPFGFFPTTQTRKSGIIIPTYGKNEYRGYFLTNGGYYWAASEYFDLTLTGDIYTQGGYGLKSASSYSKRYKYNGSLSASYNKIKFGKEEFAEFAREFFDNRSDFAITWSHNQDAKARPDFRFNASVNIASSNYYRVTSTNAQDVLQNRLNSSVSINKTWTGKPYNLTASINHSQNNQTNDMTVTLPDVNFGVNRQFPFKRKIRVGQKKWFEEIGYSYNLTGKNEIQTKLNKPFFTETVFRDSSRSGIQHRIPISANYKVFKHFVLSPSVNYTERWYFNRLDRESIIDTVNGVPTYRVVVKDTTTGFYSARDFGASAALSTKLYGTWRYKGFIRAIRHVATPSVGFSYRPDFSTDFWGYYQELQTNADGTTDKFSRYSSNLYGSPGEGKQGALNFSLQNTLEAKVKDKQDSTGLKKIRLLEGVSLNSSYNMAAEQYKWAPISLSARSSVFNGMISLVYNASFDLYGFDKGLDSTGRVIGRVNEYAFDVNGKLARITSQRITMGLNLSPERFNFNKKGKSKGDKEPVDKVPGKIDGLPPTNELGITEGDIDYYRRMGYVDFDVPWTLNVNYNLSKSYSGIKTTVTQSADISGDFEMTENWRVGFSTGYDLVAKDFTYTSFDFYRNLHCWELRCSWIPMGFQQSYTLTIRVKASTLSDLKLTRQRGIGDFER